MIKVIVVGLMLILSACNAHGLRQILVPANEPSPALSHIRMQFDCTENGLYIFDGFPDNVRAHPLMIIDDGARVEPSNMEPTEKKKNSAGHSEQCLAGLY